MNKNDYMTNEIDQIRFAVISSIEKILSQIFPDYLKGERKSLQEEVYEWARSFAKERNLRVEIRERHEPVRRSTITMRGERSFVIVIHDPLGPPRGIPAESITGADYAVEFPIAAGLDKFILVQLKRTKYGMSPKQYFGMGAFYMYAHYLGRKLAWKDRFLSGAEYVTKGKKPHEEFLFVKVIEKDTYIPLSSVLRTFKSQSYSFISTINSSSPKTGDAKYEERATYVDFSNMLQHLNEYYIGLPEFMRAANTCQIGFSHLSTAAVIRRKMDGLFLLSEILLRPNIAVIEVTNHLFQQISNL